MDDARTRSDQPFSAARSAAVALVAVLGGTLALLAGWYLAPRLVDRFAAAGGNLAWAAIGFAGGAIGVAAFAAVRVSRRRAPALEVGETHREPARGAWLQVVAGPRREAAGRAALEIAAHALASGRRVVVVDASRDFRLHEMLGLSGRLGFWECMQDDQPALGLLQNGGFTGLFLLARGRRNPLTDWLPLDRVLEELRPHFEQVILVFESRLPPVVGGVLAGRLASGWWAGPGTSRGRTATTASASLAIPLFDIDLAGTPQPSLEALEARLGALESASPTLPAHPPFVEAPAAPLRISPPAVLDCDLQVQQKLRFLAWMRRMRTERERAETSQRR